MEHSPNKKTEFEAQFGPWRVAATVTLVSGLFTLIVAVLLIANYVVIRSVDPLNSAELQVLRGKLAETPKADEELLERIRAVDLASRKAFFTSQAHLRMGGQLLLVGALVFLASFKLAARWHPVVPEVERRPGDYWTLAAQAKEYIAAGGAVLVLVALAAAYFTNTSIPSPEVAAGPGEAPPEAVSPGPEEAAPEAVSASPEAAVPTWEEMQTQWPSLRGPGGFGVAHFTTAPVSWDPAGGEGIRWRAEVALPGFNSPVVWEDRLYISGADRETRQVYCYSTETGELLWTRTLEPFPGTPAECPKIEDETGYAAPTLAALGHRVFALFPNGDVACYDRDGNVQWGFNLGVPDNHYGHGSSLIALEDLLFVQYDHNAEAKVMAFKADTGENAWTTMRKKISWSSPICAPTPWGMELILNSERDVDAYDPKTGTLLWTADCLDGEVAPSPAYADGMVFSANEYAYASAIRLSEADGAVAAEVVWQYDDILPEVSSPVASATHLYYGSSMGDVVCLDRETGEEAWVQEFDGGFYSSLILVGDRLYGADKEGVMHIFKAGSAYEAIADIEHGEPIFATPAYLDGRIYLRTASQLICIGQG